MRSFFLLAWAAFFSISYPQILAQKISFQKPGGGLVVQRGDFVTIWWSIELGNGLDIKDLGSTCVIHKRKWDTDKGSPPMADPKRGDEAFGTYGTRDDNPLLMEAVWDTEVTYSLMVDWNNSPIYDGDDYYFRVFYTKSGSPSIVAEATSGDFSMRGSSPKPDQPPKTTPPVTRQTPSTDNSTPNTQKTTKPPTPQPTVGTEDRPDEGGAGESPETESRKDVQTKKPPNQQSDASSRTDRKGESPAPVPSTTPGSKAKDEDDEEIKTENGKPSGKGSNDSSSDKTASQQNGNETEQLPSNTTKEGEKNQLSGVALAGVGSGITIAVVIALVIGFICFRRRRKRKAHSKPSENSEKPDLEHASHLSNPTSLGSDQSQESIQKAVAAELPASSLNAYQRQQSPAYELDLQSSHFEMPQSNSYFELSANQCPKRPLNKNML